MKSYKLGVIIVTYNARPWIENYFSMESELADIVFFFIDNGSTDGTIDYLKAKKFNGFLITNNKNNGFGKANNQGIKLALENKCDFFFLLNQDAWIVGNGFDSLISKHIKYPEYGILSPIHINYAQENIERNFYNWIYETGLAFDALSTSELNKDVYECLFVNAAGWLVTHDCLKMVGGFDPIFFHEGEDFNYCQRVKFNNLKIGVCPNSFMIHDRDRKKLSALNLKVINRLSFNGENLLKINYANINKSYEEAKNGVRIFNYTFSQLLLSIFKLDYKGLKSSLIFLINFSKFIREIKESRIINISSKPYKYI